MLLTVALLFTGLVAPALAGLYGILGQPAADGLSESFGYMLAMPGALVAVAGVVLTFIHLVKGPNQVRARIGVWYLFGPALFTYAAVSDPEGMNARAPFYDALMAIALAFACVLPVMWTWMGRAGSAPRATLSN